MVAAELSSAAARGAHRLWVGTFYCVYQGAPACMRLHLATYPSARRCPNRAGVQGAYRGAFDVRNCVRGSVCTRLGSNIADM